MTKVYPNASSSSTSSSDDIININGGGCAGDDEDRAAAAVVLTVWKKSLLLNCQGFTVFDPRGNLVYRVDNYMSATNPQIFLMDASGATLLTIRRKRLSLGDTWLIFDGEAAENPRFTVRKNVSLLRSSCLAHVTSNLTKAKPKAKPKAKVPLYEIQGSYARRSCVVYDDKRRRVVEMRQKEASVRGVAFGKDVFRLEVQPGFDAAVAMAMVILLDQMYASGGGG